MNDNELKTLFESIDDVLESVNLDTVSAEGTGFSNEVPDGYYLVEVEKAEPTFSKSSGNPQIAFQFSIVEDGWTLQEDDNGNANLVNVSHTAKRKIFMYFPLKSDDEGASVKRFVSDMMKFEDENGESLLPKEAFTRSDTLSDALDILQGKRIYVQVSTTVKDDKTSTWRNIISWKRARALELPIE